MKTAALMALGAVAFVAFGYIFGSAGVFFHHVWFDGGRPPIEVQQLGRRGTATQDLQNARAAEALAEANVPPLSVPHSGGVGDRAGDVYENVKVLADVSQGEFTRLMVNMTNWVAPDQGCAACHNVENFADDTLYTKVVARRMLEMVRDINANWTVHVADTGVTCYTCHRGQLVPPNIWFNNPGQTQASSFLTGTAGPQNPVAPISRSALLRDPMTRFLEGADSLKISSLASRTREERPPIKDARATHALMIHMSQALNVNCAYCHNSRAFYDWEQSRPQRATAWFGIRMVRALNTDYLVPLQPVLPAHRLGAAMGDAPKANCATCHNGAFKPLLGLKVLQDFPELKGPARPTAEPPEAPMAEIAPKDTAEGRSASAQAP
jgi:photosynthetic reaction center cytochrome c subunit